MTTSKCIDVQYKSGAVPDPELHPPVNRRTVVADGMRIDYDVAVPMRDGVNILIDIFRPDTDVAVPAIVAWSPYGKHAPVGYDVLEGSGVEPHMVSKYCALEAPDPAQFCPEGFAVINVDPRGTWNSPGRHDFWGRVEAKDEYDLIEWIAERPWCTGKVGMGGVSYLAVAQWFAAAERPPHLAAIIPWEGVSDTYREHAFHGGIPETKFLPFVQMLAGFSAAEVEDVAKMQATHPFDDEYWATKRVDLAAIDVPAYIVASWGDHGLHTRGTLEGWKQISSAHKYLEVHGRKKWEYYYTTPCIARQKAFYARYLKDDHNEVDQWPAVRYEVRDSYYNGTHHTAADWPIPETDYKRLYLDGSNGSLITESPAEASTVQYDAQTQSTHFDIRFEATTEVVGNAALTLWVEANGAEDMDLFVGIEKLDTEGRPVGFPYFSTREDGPVAFGWLRASHRELDDQRSTPAQPWHLHHREQLLSDHQIVEVQIEIWPSATIFHSGETLRLIIQGHDLRVYDHPATMRHDSTRNAGAHLIHTGGIRLSSLLIPVVTR